MILAEMLMLEPLLQAATIKSNYTSLAFKLFILMSITILAACSDQDENFIPYKIKGMTSHVYDNQTGESFDAGSVVGKYSERESMLLRCSEDAVALASDKHIEDWSYVCCTQTSESSCATKVR